MIFTYQPRPVRIIFGIPLIEALQRELPGNRDQNIWIVASSRFNNLVDLISKADKLNVAGRFSEVVQHVPEQQVEKAVNRVKRDQPDLLLSVGGGSATGLAKAIALEYPVPVWAAPTTYSGSEMTDIYGISSSGKKKVGRSNRVLPRKVFYDPAISADLPTGFAIKSAMNAMAHLVEAVYSTDNNPFSYQSALQGIESVFGGMKNLTRTGTLTTSIHQQFLFGGCLAGKTLSEVSMGLHHKAAHVLGGNFGLDHAGVHTVLLPYIFNYQWTSLNAEVQKDFRNAFSVSHPPVALKKISQKLGAPFTLKEIGFNKEYANKAAKQLMKLSFGNPAPLDEHRLTILLQNAFDGIMA
jgi:maleylacetate reductase